MNNLKKIKIKINSIAKNFGNLTKCSDDLNKAMLMGLAILNPIYFTWMLVGARTTIQVRLSVILEGLVGPCFYLF